MKRIVIIPSILALLIIAALTVYILIERKQIRTLEAQREADIEFREDVLSQMVRALPLDVFDRQHDWMIIPPAGLNVEEIFGAIYPIYKTYQVDIRTTSISEAYDGIERYNRSGYKDTALLRRLIELTNIGDVNYYLFYSGCKRNIPPEFPDDKTLRSHNFDFYNPRPGFKVLNPSGDSWELLLFRNIRLDVDRMIKLMSGKPYDANNPGPVYIMPHHAPVHEYYSIRKLDGAYSNLDSLVYYPSGEMPGNNPDIKASRKTMDIVFQPPYKDGWYKLYISSRTGLTLSMRIKDGRYPWDFESGSLRIMKEQIVQYLDYVYDTRICNVPDYRLLWGNLKNDSVRALFKKSMKNAQTLLQHRSSEDVRRVELYDFFTNYFSEKAGTIETYTNSHIEYNIKVTTPRPVRQMMTY